MPDDDDNIVRLETARTKASPSINSDEALSGTEDEIALEFSRQNSEILRYVNLWHRWFRWDGVLWRRIEDLSVFHQIRLLARRYAKLHNDKKLARDAATASIERAARNDPRHDTSVEAWDLGLRAFHTPNRNTTE